MPGDEPEPTPCTTQFSPPTVHVAGEVTDERGARTSRPAKAKFAPGAPVPATFVTPTSVVTTKSPVTDLNANSPC